MRVHLRLQSIKARLVFFALLCAVPVIAFSVLQVRHDVEQLRNDAIQDAHAALDRLQTRVTFRLAAAELAGRLTGALPDAFESSGPCDAEGMNSEIARDDDLLVALIDRDGILVCRSDDTTRVAGATATSLGRELDRVRAAAPGPVQLIWLDDRERLYLARPMLYRGDPVMWGAAGVDAQALHAQAVDHLGAQLPLVLLVAAAVVLLAVAATRPLVLGRVQGLLRASAEVREGRYGSRVRVRVDDELATVENAFNQMLEAVEADRLRLERSEAHYRMLFEASIDGVLSTRPTGEILAANAAAERILGRPAEDIVRLRRSDLLPDSDPAMRRFLDMRRAHGLGMAELRFHRPDGSFIDVDCWSTVCADRDGNPVTWTVLHDVTQRKQAQREIEQLNRELEERVRARTRELAIANEELESFSSSVSHDLRASVAVVRAFSQILLERRVLEGKDLRYLERVNAAGENMAELIAALLDLARFGRTRPEPKAVDLSQLARDVAQECRDATGRELDVQVQPGGTAVGDPGLLRVVMSNLLANAWKFTRDVPAPKVEVGFRAEGGECVVTVRDNGAGFDETYASRLFQPFQRLHGTHEFPGLGIGLATVYRIVIRHGGRIWASGRVGGGAAFQFTLPL